MFEELSTWNAWSNKTNDFVSLSVYICAFPSIVVIVVDSESTSGSKLSLRVVYCGYVIWCGGFLRRDSLQLLTHFSEQHFSLSSTEDFSGVLWRSLDNSWWVPSTKILQCEAETVSLVCKHYTHQLYFLSHYWLLVFVSFLIKLLVVLSSQDELLSAASYWKFSPLYIDNINDL